MGLQLFQRGQLIPLCSFATNRTPHHTDSWQHACWWSQGALWEPRPRLAQTVARSGTSQRHSGRGLSIPSTVWRTLGYGFHTVGIHHKYGLSRHIKLDQVRTRNGLPGAPWWPFCQVLEVGTLTITKLPPLPPQRSRSFPTWTQIYSWASG